MRTLLILAIVLVQVRQLAARVFVPGRCAFETFHYDAKDLSAYGYDCLKKHAVKTFSGASIAASNSGSSSFLSPERFTGKERDAETGLDYFGARYMASAQGRFTSPDLPFAAQRPDDPQSWNLYGYVLNNPLRYIDPNGLWELDVTAETTGRRRVEVTVTVKKSQEGDNAASLAQQLGYDPSSKEGKKVVAQLEKALAGGDSARLSKAGGNIGAVFGAVERGLTAQANYMGSQGGPSDSQFNDCSMTSCRIAFPDQMQGYGGSGASANFGVQSADELLKNSARPVHFGRVGDIIRYADEANAPQHFMTAIFRNDAGVLQTFSRSGVNGPFEIVPKNAFAGSNYGRVRGLTEGQSGIYRRR